MYSLSDDMFNSSDCSMSLDNLFFEKPVIHKVKPLQQGISPWRLETPPSLSQIPCSRDMPEEAESLSLYSFSQTPFPPPPSLPPFKVQSSDKVNRSFGFNHNETGTVESQPGNNSRCDGLWGGEGIRDYSQGACQRGRGTNETPQDSGHVAVGRTCFSPDRLQSPPLRRSLFKVQVSNSGGDSSHTDDLSICGGSSSQTASRPQTFLSQVAMATVPPPLQPPRATVCQAAPPFPQNPPSASPLPGSSAASGRPPQQAALSKMPDKGTKRAFVPPMTPQPLCIQGSAGSEVLRPVSEIPSKFRSVFSEFPFFNYVQSKALDDVLYTGKNFVAGAPTGSGKTVLFELAIIRMLMETSEPWRDVKAVYIAPIKALCSQCYESWQKKFGPLGLTCKELTGDTAIDDFYEIQDSHIILTTPEKWDRMTRKWKDNCLLQLVRLFLIDEVHVVKDTTRGATLEVVVSRMKAMHSYRTAQNPEADLSLRFVAVSATIPNICDIAEWLSNESGPAIFLDMDESHRPVKLRKVVLGFPCNQNQTEFKFDLSLNYKMANIIQTYSDQKPTLVFCSTRKGAQQSASVLAKDARFIMSIEHKQRLMKYGKTILDSKLRDLILLGVGFHHAGVELSDRKLVEEAFTLGDLPVLFTTRTLAMGVNLPAHLVVIKSTMQYVAGSCEDYSEADMLQMIGRAGRPQFDTSATAVIMTKIQTRDKYLRLMNGTEIIESSLHKHLVEHLNAEIVLQTISDVNMALDWIRSTFLYIRALKNPTHYGFSANLDRYGIEGKLQGLCLKNLNSLSSIGLIDMDEDINIRPTEAGRLMARYYVAFDTMTQFCKVVGSENLSDLIDLLSKSREFSDIQLRVNERRSLNTMNKDKNRVTIRFPFQGKIKTSEMKVNCLIQAQLGSISIQEFGLTQDTARIFRNGVRISKCLSEFLSQRSQTGFTATLNSLILAKCFKAKLWENSHYISRQLEKIGQTLSTAMVNAGLTTFSKIEDINARELELIVNRHPPFGNQIKDSVVHLPKYEVTLEQLPRYSSATAELVVKVNLKNQEQLMTRRTAPDNHYVSLIIGDCDNSVLFLQKVTDSILLRSGSWSKKIEVAKASKGEDISVNLISSEYVGLDIQQKFSVYYSGARRFGNDNSCNVAHEPIGQKRTQQSAMKQQPTDSAATQRESAPVVMEQDSENKRQCNHLCKNKELCGHDCCKVGVNVAKKRLIHHGSSFSSYLSDLKSRSDTLTQTPVKRFRMNMKEESVYINKHQFAYKPKEVLPSVSRYGVSQSGASERPNTETIDLTGEDGQEVAYTIYQDDFDSDFDDCVGDMLDMTEEPTQTASSSYAHNHSSTVWTNSKTSAWSQKPDQTSTTQASPLPTATVRNSHSNHSFSSSSHIPTVTFDLGHEWDDIDDWGDFDEENLVHASEMSSSSYTTNPTAHTQRLLEANILATSTPALFFGSMPLSTAKTPLRSISSNIRPEIRKTAPSPVTVRSQNRVTLDCNRKGSDISQEEIRVPTAENLPPQKHMAPENRTLDFFYTVTAPAKTSSRVNNSILTKEEEAYIGIFDGLF